MAKRVRRRVSRRAQKRAKSSTKGRKRAVAKARTVRASARRPVKKKGARKKLVRKGASRRRTAAKAPAARLSAPDRLNRSRRVLTEDDTLRTPPSSLDMNRHGSAARTGRKGLDANIRRHNDMTPALTGGDVDADW